VGLARRLSIFGRNADMLATVCGSSRDRFIYGSRTVANHVQGRENGFTKEQLYHAHKLACRRYFLKRKGEIYFSVAGGLGLRSRRPGCQIPSYVASLKLPLACLPWLC